MSVRPKKRLGQHFLTDPNTVRRIADAVAAPPGARVVEIGPGEGALTGVLLERYPDLVALEVDPEAVAHLRAAHPALDVRQGDVLEADWGALAGEGGRDEGQEGGAASGPPRPRRPPPLAPPVQEGDSPQTTPLTRGGAVERGGAPDARPPSPPSLVPSPAPQALYVVGNLPYYITSPILFALLDAREHVARAVVMVQKEVADRLAAPPGSKTYGTLSVYFGLYAETRTLFTVSRHCFRPKPAVESAVVALDFGAAEPPDVAFPALQRVVRAAFGQRRKMLRNSLGTVAEAAGVAVPEWAATLRPEAVSPADFVRLARHFDAA
ncbi:ribosomal RNA small subunit methyltransferase A [Rubrivirga litoralis]|uniref:Ribosomal RNA small subunit methyltransferase A n=1 Tax=Rubrivirga litoralis TaxID=3075598 RepID=A0ABU3BN96_9BACT|nr:rRNA adenine dimethyltransferase family protein [Rubrivirga sp. F394]MDT0630695.1 rRNA adenine dimethyltransferase family protein [Rubrivirga sp. F394]